MIATVREVLRGDTRKGGRAVLSLFQGKDDVDARVGARLVTLALLRLIGPEGGNG